MTGTGGAGKTHLLCDLAKTRTAKNLPTIIVLGEQFERGPIETDLGRIIDSTARRTNYSRPSKQPAKPRAQLG